MEPVPLTSSYSTPSLSPTPATADVPKQAQEEKGEENHAVVIGKEKEGGEPVRRISTTLAFSTYIFNKTFSGHESSEFCFII